MRLGRTTAHEKGIEYEQGGCHVRDRFDTRAASRTSSVIPDAPQAPPSVAPIWEARKGEFDPAWASRHPPIAPMEVTDEPDV
jgi:hypothetical protein